MFGIAGPVRVFCLLILFTCVSARADAPLFSSHETLEITIPLNFKSLCRPRDSEGCDFAPTTLEYTAGDSTRQAIPVGIIIRGGWRSLVKNCAAPLLFVRFDESHTAGTPFEGQSLLPLTTHCGRGRSLEATAERQPKNAWEQYLLREYLAYRLYNTVTGLSLRARLVKIRYPNPDKPSRIIENYAFFTEHFKSLAGRSDAVKLPRGEFDHERLDAQAAAVLALFQFMIGNTDYSVVRERNTIMLDRAGRQFPVPYDFDMSGLVNTHYAGPAPTLPIDSVRKRYYLGYCHPDNDWDALFDLFLDRREPVLSLVEQVPGLDKGSRKSSRRFLNAFFELLDDPGDRRKSVIEACLDWPPNAEDHMTPFTR